MTRLCIFMDIITIMYFVYNSPTYTHLSVYSPTVNTSCCSELSYGHHCDCL